MLLVPAGDQRMVEKAREGDAEVSCSSCRTACPFDNGAKAHARETVCNALSRPFPRQREINVRINAVSSPWLRATAGSAGFRPRSGEGCSGSDKIADTTQRGSPRYAQPNGGR